MDAAHNTPSIVQPSRNRVNKANRDTNAARWNVRTLRGLEDALRKDPEIDLASLLRTGYSDKLESFKTLSARPKKDSTTRTPLPAHDIRSRLCTTDNCEILRSLSSELRSLLGHGDLAKRVIELLDQSQVLYKSAWAASSMTFKASETIVVKVTNEAHITNEYHTLEYLEKHLPSFPIPRLHGVIRFGIYGLLFTTFIPGLDLGKVWPKMDAPDKISVSAQLDNLLRNLRSLPSSPDAPLGGVNGQGCQDARGLTRLSTEPILTVQQFQNFIFGGSKTASSLYVRLLRELVPKEPAEVVFTHGDIRPANIMVDKDEAGRWSVVSIIDWESSGFYPDYWEAVKMTNNLTPRDEHDWYCFLPDCVSPRRFATHWLLDRVWDRSLSNN